MKHSLIILSIAIYGPLFSQSETQIKDERQEIWNSAVNAIITFDQESIFQFTNFPLEGDWYVPEDQTDEELKALYKKGLEYLYPQELREYLKSKNYNSLIAHPYKQQVAFAFTYYDELMDFTTIVDFFKVAGEWKIVSVSIN